MLEYKVLTATIAVGASLSDALQLGGYKFFTIMMPAGWDAAALTLQGSADGVTYEDLWMDGAEVSCAVAAGKAYAMNLNALALASLPYVKLRSGTSAVPVVQTAARTIKIVGSY